MVLQTLFCKLCQQTVRAVSADAHRRAVHQSYTFCMYPRDGRIQIFKHEETEQYHCCQCNYSHPSSAGIRRHASKCYGRLADAYLLDEDDPPASDPPDDGFGPSPSQQRSQPDSPPLSPAPSPAHSASASDQGSYVPASQRDVSTESVLSVIAPFLAQGTGRFSPVQDPAPPPSIASRPRTPDSDPDRHQAHPCSQSSVDLPLRFPETENDPCEESLVEAEVFDIPPEIEIPPGSDVVITPTFQRWGIALNTTHGVLICLDCKTCVPRDYLRKHLRLHQYFDASEETIAEALGSFDVLKVRQPIMPATDPIVPAVFGLNVLPDCFFCAGCNRGYGSLKSLSKNHFAKSSCNPSRKHYKGPGQTFFTNNCRYVFPVALPTPPSPRVQTNSAFSLYLQSVSPSDLAHRPLVLPANDRSFARFVYTERWFHHLVGHTPAALVSLCALDGVDHCNARICEVALQYLQKVVQLLKQAPPQVKRQVAQYSELVAHFVLAPTYTNLWFGSDPYGGAFTVIRDNTVAQYAKYLSQLIYFVVRAVVSPDRDYEVPLTDAQRSACQTFVERLPESTQADLQSPLHGLLYSLVAHTSTSKLDKYFSPVTRFQVISALTAQGDFIKANDIRRLNAQLIYIMRSVVFTEIVLRMEMESKPFHPVYSELRTFLSADAETPFAYCAAVAGILKSQDSLDQMMPSFQFKDLEQTTILYQDIEFSHTSVAVTVRGALAEYDTLLASKLLFGLPKDHPAFHMPNDISSLLDQPQNFDPGFCFLDDPRNNLAHLRTALLRLLVEEPRLSGRFHYVQGTQFVFRAHTCRQWLEDAHDAERRLCTCIHLSSGQPPRGAELASVTYRNIAGGSARGIYTMHGFLVMLTGYWKCADLTGRDKLIARVPSPDVAQRLLFHLAVIRPVQVALSRIFLDEAATNRFEHYLFPGLHRPFDGDSVSDCLQADTVVHLDCSIGLRPYRQLVSALTRWNRPDFALPDPLHPYEVQRGHQRSMFDSQYGLSTDMLVGADPRSIVAQICASTAWHYDTGLGQKFIARGYRVVPATDTPAQPSAGAAPPSASLPSSSASPSSEPGQLVEAIAGQVCTYLSKHLAAGVAGGLLPGVERSLEKFVAVVTSNQPASALTITSTSAVQYQVHPDRLRALREFVDDPCASFTSPLQGQALEVYLSRKVNLMACLPTGHGKSLLFFLPAKMYEKDRTTIVVVPLHSLHADFARRAASYGIAHRRWEPGVALAACSVPLVLVSPEHARTKAFLDFASQLHNLDLLLRIVFDEAHMFITHASFRDCFNDMRHLRRVGVPFVLLSATVAPHLESPLFDKLSIKDVVTFRLPSTRPEISIRIKPFALKRDMHAAFERDARKYSSSLHPHERGLIFCKTIAEVKHVATTLGLHPFYASLEEDIKTARMSAFVNGDIKVLVSSSTLGEGLDLPSIRFVLHYGLPRHPASFVQESGRMARDRVFGTSAVYFLQSERLAVPEPDLLGVAVINHWSTEDICRRIRIAEYLDGVPTQCSVLLNPNLCDVCSQQLNSPLSPLSMFPEPFIQPHSVTHAHLADSYDPAPYEAPNIDADSRQVFSYRF
ncbi:hypothetical protein EVJ58_g7926 [Rhodofomes roseus]|uniref:DNA 3'-5' helicase n=1 Tax=Rhodofomes roseus TaxID=34475 RepID=A0A4Y9Y3H9_9APHY|nr:hypothetical protein EVJ58_g7926 [Rhodofomes roseus]